MGCDICATAKELGWWGPTMRGTHCEGCHRSWISKAQSHCTECHRHFGSDSAGDAHSIRGECVDPNGFDRYDTPDGPIFGGRDPETTAAAVRRMNETPVAV